MAPKTTSGSGFDPKFRPSAPDFLLESGFVAACRRVLTEFTLRALKFAHVSSATVPNAILALLYLENETSQKSPTFHIRRLSYIVYNAAKTLGPSVKLRAGGRLDIGQKTQECRHGSPDKSMMPLSYDLEIFPAY